MRNTTTVLQLVVPWQSRKLPRTMAERKAFKDYFDKDAAKALAKQLARGQAGFPQRRFVNIASKGLEPLEMMARVSQFSSAMRSCLPDDIPAALQVIIDSLPEELPDCENITNGFLLWPVGQFIVEHTDDHFEAALPAMVELTKRFSSEFAVRRFVELEPERTFVALLELTEDPNPHVRRWCSEGTRPRLPWGKRLDALVKDPSPILPIVEALKDDPERYVQRSVANNLNDITKDHPNLVVSLCKRWLKKAPPGREWIVRHALRVLVKKGHPGALKLLGYGAVTGLKGKLVVTPKRIAPNEKVNMKLTLSCPKAAKLMVDYRIHLVKANGEARPTVFKWKQVSLKAGQSVTLQKAHAMRVTTIRTLFAGRHKVDIQVNGQVIADGAFHLDIP